MGRVGVSEVLWRSDISKIEKVALTAVGESMNFWVGARKTMRWVSGEVVSLTVMVS